MRKEEGCFQSIIQDYLTGKIKGSKRQFSVKKLFITGEHSSSMKIFGQRMHLISISVLSIN